MSTMGDIVSAGSGHAVTVVNSMLGVTAQVSPTLAGPPSLLTQLDDVRGRGTVVRLDIPNWGALLMCLDDDAAARWLRVLSDHLPTGELTELERSALSELVNILGSRFLDAMSKSLQRQLVPSPPHLRSGDLASLVREELEALGPTAVATNRFEIAGEGLGRFVLMSAAAKT